MDANGTVPPRRQFQEGGGIQEQDGPPTHFALCKVARSFQAQRGAPQGLLVAVVEHCRRERRTVRVLQPGGGGSKETFTLQFQSP